MGYFIPEIEGNLRKHMVKVPEAMDAIPGGDWCGGKCAYVKRDCCRTARENDIPIVVTVVSEETDLPMP
jgi:hypothetical protein